MFKSQLSLFSFLILVLLNPYQCQCQRKLEKRGSEHIMNGRLQHLQNLRNIFLKSVDSVRPHNLLSSNNGFNLHPREDNNNELNIQLQGRRVNIKDKRCYAVGFGKAVLGMAVELEKALGDSLQRGILSIPKVG